MYECACCIYVSAKSALFSSDTFYVCHLCICTHTHALPYAHLLLYGAIILMVIIIDYFSVVVWLFEICVLLLVLKYTCKWSGFRALVLQVWLKSPRKVPFKLEK